MKYFKVIVAALFLYTGCVFSQGNSKHIIVKGETISSIAQKYNVSINSIYKLNPEAKKTLHLNQVLLIPNSEPDKATTQESIVAEQTTEINHQVLPKETLYGITKQFKTTKELLYKANPKLETEGLKIGETITIPSTLTKKEIADLSNSKVQDTNQTPALLTHKVKVKESLYVIAKQYGVTLKELQNANPNIGSKGLKIDQVIAIPANGKLVETEVVINEDSKTKEISISENTKEVSLPVNVEVLKTKETVVDKTKTTVSVDTESIGKEIKLNPEDPANEISHIVLTKETKYGIARKYGITVADLERQNPSIQQRLDVGTKLIIRGSNAIIEKPVPSEAVVSPIENRKDTTSVALPVASADLIEQLIQSASDKIGTRYRSGGTTTEGFDCSGLMCSTFAAFDIKLPRTSIEQSSFGEKINDENVQKGDLIFFKTNGRSRINHVGMVVEVINDEIKFIHSSTHSGVIISSTKEPYYQRNFAQVNRVIK